MGHDGLVKWIALAVALACLGCEDKKAPEDRGQASKPERAQPKPPEVAKDPKVIKAYLGERYVKEHAQELS